MMVNSFCFDFPDIYSCSEISAVCLIFCQCCGIPYIVSFFLYNCAHWITTSSIIVSVLGFNLSVPRYCCVILVSIIFIERRLHTSTLKR